eukprot:CAMPEP_0197634728 /NCGR_PEP_ID=MMETSP1338-20131121/10740_1 /TAXON_ID=43686 ORGANISM="Pelagodinium beii, Strain RCC1491" /NCGR_SAMPLE_ID=MMETSP1338 /ASSEMBLY_ACC=CAM_ASM_000754 /LENGTH=245 /DNA_ID=CAMNT_0043206645 /DNA_START=663 /DNA_END=1400 /DNA_ORIENTATION=-
MKRPSEPGLASAGMSASISGEHPKMGDEERNGLHLAARALTGPTSTVTVSEDSCSLLFNDRPNNTQRGASKAQIARWRGQLGTCTALMAVPAFAVSVCMSCPRRASNWSAARPIAVATDNTLPGLHRVLTRFFSSRETAQLAEISLKPKAKPLQQHPELALRPSTSTSTLTVDWAAPPPPLPALQRRRELGKEFEVQRCWAAAFRLGHGYSIATSLVPTPARKHCGADPSRDSTWPHRMPRQPSD